MGLIRLNKKKTIMLNNTFKEIAASSCVASNMLIALTLKIRSPGSKMPFWSAGLPGAI